MTFTSQTRFWLSLGLCLGAFAPSTQTPNTVYMALSADAIERTEYFLIHWDSEAPHPGVGYDGDLQLGDALQARELGLIEIRCRMVDGGWQLEQDVRFPFEDVRLMAVERIGENNPGLIWREISGGAGRTIFAEWGSALEDLHVREWSPKGSQRNTQHGDGAVYMPLSLIEAARQETLEAGPLQVFDPLRGELETWGVALTTATGDSPSSTHRSVEFTRPDGSLAGSYHFERGQLKGFRWQHGGLRMTRILHREHAERRLLWGLETDE